MKKYQPQLDTDIAAKEVPLLRQLGISDDTKKLGLGVMTKEKMAQTEELTIKYLNLGSHLPVADLYTNDFLA
jgi:hypothetical protein